MCGISSRRSNSTIFGNYIISLKIHDNILNFVRDELWIVLFITFEFLFPSDIDKKNPNRNISSIGTRCTNYALALSMSVLLHVRKGLFWHIDVCGMQAYYTASAFRAIQMYNNAYMHCTYSFSRSQNVKAASVQQQKRE